MNDLVEVCPECEHSLLFHGGLKQFERDIGYDFRCYEYLDHGICNMCGCLYTKDGYE